jgi:hypothetical protein
MRDRGPKEALPRCSERNSLNGEEQMKVRILKVDGGENKDDLAVN